VNQGLHLTLLVGDVRPEPVPQAVIEALIQVQVTSSSTGQSGFQLQLTLGKRSEVARRLLPAGYFDPRRRVIVVATVAGTPRVLMDGIVTKQDVSPSSDAGQSQLTVTGLDLSVLMDFIDLTGVPLPPIPPHAVVAMLLSKYAVFGVVPVTVPSLIGLIENPLDKIKAQVGTDLAFINQLGQRVGHVFHIDPGPRPGMSRAYWGPEVRFGAPQPALTVNSDAATNVESISFSHDGLARRQLLVVIQEKTTKVPIPIPVPDISLLKPPLAARPAGVLKTQRLEAAKLTPADAALLALSGVAGSSDAVTGSGQLDVLRYGLVLEPRRLVAVRGAGLAYDGLYYVRSVTHNLRRGAWTQSFSLVRGGTMSTIARVEG
jgi:hypothetical protein